MDNQVTTPVVNYTPLVVQKVSTPEKKVGRPSGLDERTVQNLEAYLQRGMSRNKACEKAHVPRSNFYYWLDHDQAFLYKVIDAENYLTLHAADNITNEIVQKKNPIYSWKLLEKKDPEGFGPPTAVTINNTNLTYVKTGRDKVASGFDAVFAGAEGVSQEISAEGNSTQPAAGTSQ